MKLFRTQAGAVVEDRGRSFSLPPAPWDDVIRAPRLAERLRDQIARLSPRPGPVDEAEALAPIGGQEVWAAGVTYFRSRDARIEHHIALDVPSHEPMVSWCQAVFGMDLKRMFDRRGEFIATMRYSDSPLDAVGRRPGFTPLFLRQGNPGTTLNHIAFDFADADGAIRELESRGLKVDLPQDAMIHGPEEMWYQIDSRDTPYPIGHPANDPGVPLFPYRYD